MSRLDFESFQEEVGSKILDLLPPEYQNGTVEFTKFRKLGTSYNAMIVTNHKNEASPVVNLDQFYEDYMETGNLENQLKQISEMLMLRLEEDIEWIKDYGKIKERLFIRASNAEKNKEFLEGIPHMQVGDFAITCHNLIGNDDDGLKSAIISKPVLNSFGVTEEQLFEDAMENSQAIMPATIHHIKDILGPLEDISLSSSPILTPLLVVSNELKINGAAAFFYPETMEKVCEQMDGDYYMIPSSIHEVIIAPVTDAVNPTRLHQTLHYVNENMAPSDVLGTEIYRYNALEKVLEGVPVNDYQMKLEPSLFY